MSEKNTDGCYFQSKFGISAQQTWTLCNSQETMDSWISIENVPRETFHTSRMISRVSNTATPGQQARGHTACTLYRVLVYSTSMAGSLYALVDRHDHEPRLSARLLETGTGIYRRRMALGSLGEPPALRHVLGEYGHVLWVLYYMALWWPSASPRGLSIENRNLSTAAASSSNSTDVWGCRGVQ